MRSRFHFQSGPSERGPSKSGLVARLAPLALMAGLAAVPHTARADAPTNDYPTEARVDYVLACMAVNGQGRDVMSHCACSIDTIASIIPYDRYEQAQTILSMRQGVGQNAMVFKSVKSFDDIVATVRRAQAEADVLCFR